MLQFPHTRQQTVLNYRWLNGAWTRRATGYRTLGQERWRECQGFLQAWLNKRVRDGDSRES